MIQTNTSYNLQTHHVILFTLCQAIFYLRLFNECPPPVFIARDRGKSRPRLHKASVKAIRVSRHNLEAPVS